MIPGSFPITVGSGYYAPAVTFNGSTDYLLRSSALSGVVSGQFGTISVWINPTGGGGTSRTIMWIAPATINTSLIFALVPDGRVQVVVYQGSGMLMSLVTTTAIASNSGWHHVCASWQNGTNAGNVYTDGVFAGTATMSAGGVTYNSVRSAVGATINGDSKFPGDIAELYLNTTTCIDFSVPANLAKFRTTAGTPAFLGTDGSVPTGSQPAIYLTGPASTINVNKGFGGDFVINGTPTNAPTSPSD